MCHGIDRSVVNWDLVVTEPGNEEDKANNAKYAISVARKLGACVFVVAEDIVQVMSRMIMLFCASLWHCENERTVGGGATAGGGGGGGAAGLGGGAETPTSAAVLSTPQVRAHVWVAVWGGGGEGGYDGLVDRVGRWAGAGGEEGVGLP